MTIIFECDVKHRIERWNPKIRPAFMPQMYMEYVGMNEYDKNNG